MASRTPYHVAIVDRVMPEMDGYQLARAVRSDPNLNDTKLIMLTAFDVHEHRDLAMQAGYSAFLTKPLKQSQLSGRLSDGIV